GSCEETRLGTRVRFRGGLHKASISCPAQPHRTGRLPSLALGHRHHRPSLDLWLTFPHRLSNTTSHRLSNTTHTRTHIHTRTQTDTHKQTHKHTYTPKHRHPQTHTHTHTHRHVRHTHTHTHTQRYKTSVYSDTKHQYLRH